MYIQPNAKKSEFSGHQGDCIKIKIKSPPIDGKANDAVIEFLSDFFSLPKFRVTIIAGEKSRFKTINIDTMDEKIKNKLLGIKS